MTAVRRMIPTIVMIVFILSGGVSGCAFIRLNGCRQLAICGELAAYACGDEHICADADGKTVRSEPVRSSRHPCRVCVP